MRVNILLVFLFIACTNDPDEQNSSPGEDDEKLVRYARGFNIQGYDDIHLLHVNQPFQDADKGFKYWLIPKELELPDSLANENIIRTPVESIVVTSTSHIPLLDYMGETGALVGFPTLDLISSEAMRTRIDSGLVTDLGRDTELNFEVLVKIKPELVMTYLLSGDQTQLKRMNNAGIPVIVNADYLEQHPLGRAEWIKVAGLLFNKKSLADSVFNAVADEYNALTIKANFSEAPSVMTGIMYGDTWYLPGGDNYAAHLFEDAGLNYLWNDDHKTGFLQLSFEAVYEKARTADLWIGTASIGDLETLKNTDSRYTWFKSFKEGDVYTYTKRIGPTGGNIYLELGYLRPDLILGDLIQIGHPEIFPDRELYFYKKLE